MISPIPLEQARKTMCMLARGNIKFLPWFLYLVAALLLFNFLLRPPQFTATDLPTWGADWGAFICRLFGEGDCRSLSKFPIAYLFNSFFLQLVEPESRHLVVFFINCLFFLSSLFFVGYLNAGAIFPYLIAIIFTIIPPFYIYSGAIEVQYGIVLGIFSASLIAVIIKKMHSRCMYVILSFSAFALPLYKDTSFPLIGLIFVSVIFFATKDRTIKSITAEIYRSRFVIVWLLVVLCISASMVVAYNFFRYQSFLPLPYIDEAKNAAPPFLVKVANFFWLFLSPNGGMVASWFSAITVLWVLLGASKFRPSNFGVAISLGIILFNVLLLANWWTPFGWEGWGNRLIIPALLAGLIILGSTSVKCDQERCDFGFVLSVKNIFPSVGFFLLLFFSFNYIQKSYSTERDKYLAYGLWGADSCKAVSELRANRPMWEFKKSKVHLMCHHDRFIYWPGAKMDLSPLGVLENRKYLIQNGSGAGLIGRGWSHVEDLGVWSEGSESQIRFLSKSKFSKIVVELQPLVYGDLLSQVVIGNFLGKEIFRLDISSTQKIEIPLPDGYVYNPDEIIALDLTFPSATSPFSLGLNQDKRVIAFKLLSLELI